MDRSYDDHRTEIPLRYREDLGNRTNLGKTICVCILITSQLPFLAESSSDKPQNFVLELQNVEIHQYATFNVTLTEKSISPKDFSVLDVGYTPDREALRELRDHLVQCSKRENSPFGKIHSGGTELDIPIKIELKDGSVMYYDGVTLERVIEIDSYQFESIEGVPHPDEPIGTDQRISPYLDSNNALKEIKNFLRDIENSDIYEIWIYTVITADNLIIMTENKTLENADECYEFMKKNWYYSVVLGGQKTKDTTLESSGQLKFFLPNVEFICFLDPKTRLKGSLIWRIVAFYEIKRTLVQIGKTIEGIEGDKENLYNSFDDYSLEEFVKVYENAVYEFVILRDFLNRSSRFYDSNSSILHEFDEWNTFMHLKSDCQEHLSKISILEKDFALAKELYVVKAHKEQLDRSNWILYVAIASLIVSNFVLACGSRKKATSKDDYWETQDERSRADDFNLGYR